MQSLSEWGSVGPLALYLMAWKCKGKNKKKKEKKAKAKRKINKATSRETMPATAATTGRGEEFSLE